MFLDEKAVITQSFAEEALRFAEKLSLKYFISYYDYYHPESYMPAKDQYIDLTSSADGFKGSRLPVAGCR